MCARAKTKSKIKKQEEGKSANNRNVQKQPEKTVSFKYRTTPLVFALALSTLKRNVITPFQIFFHCALHLIKVKLTRNSYLWSSIHFWAKLHCRECERKREKKAEGEIDHHMCQVFTCAILIEENIILLIISNTSRSGVWMSSVITLFIVVFYILKFHSNWFWVREINQRCWRNCLILSSSNLSTWKQEANKRKTIDAQFHLDLCTRLSRLALLVLKQLSANTDVSPFGKKINKHKL